jgi:hypothetical protein
MAAGGFETARARCHTPRVLPQIMSSYDEATSFFCQVKAARSERTARSWRDAIESAREQLLGEVEQAVDEGPRDDDSAVHPMPTAARRRLDVA